MPFHYAISPNHLLAYARASASVTLPDFLALRQALERDPAFEPTFAIVLDLADADLTKLSSSDINRLAVSGFARTTARAIVAPQTDHYGLARMFQTYRSLAGGAGEVMVCESLREALAWLGAKTFVPADLTPVVRE